MGKILMLMNKNLYAYFKSKFTAKSLKLLIIIVFFVYLIYPGRFNKRYSYFSDDVIKNFLIRNRLTLETCPVLLNASLEVIDVSEEYVNEEKWAKERNIEPGGKWSPNCDPAFEIALVVPFRNRPSQLKIFLSHIHQFLQKQYIKYQIFIIEQVDGKPFNRGKLMNVGYNEGLKRGKFSCFIFHDVDLIPQVLRNIYACADWPRHMSASINVWRYNLLYDDNFGGVIAILANQFQTINGFSNSFFGWGGEDDDLLMRVKKHGMSILRFSPEVSRYLMLPHQPEPKNPERYTMLKSGEDKFQNNGLNSLNYQVVTSSNKPLYTHVIVDI